MNKPKYTPGPWQINKHTKERDGSVFADVPNELHSIDDRLCICVAPHLDKNERWMANARLIAAAPDLLQEAETLLMEQCRNCGFGSRCPHVGPDIECLFYPLKMIVAKTKCIQ